MIKEHIINQISSQISNLLKASPINDFENNFKAILRAGLIKADLVTREEFDTQQKVLLNTRKKLEELEQIVEKLQQSSSHP